MDSISSLRESRITHVGLMQSLPDRCSTRNRDVEIHGAIYWNERQCEPDQYQWGSRCWTEK